MPNVEHWKIQDRESVSINQDQIDHLFSQKQVQSKTTSILQSAQTPTALAITFQGYFSVHGIMIENSGIQVLDFSDGNKEIPVLINIQEHQNKRVIFVQSGIVIINNTSLDLAFINNHEELAVEATKAIPIPYNWIESVSNISIKTHIGDILINQGSHFNIDSNQFVTVENYMYKTENNTSLVVIEVNPPYTFQNLLPCHLTIHLDNDVVASIPSGQEVCNYNLDPQKDHKFKYEVCVSETIKFNTAYVDFSGRKRISFVENPESSICIDKISKDFKNCSNLDLIDLEKTEISQSDTLLVKNNLYVVSVEHIIINKTGLKLQANKLVLEPDQLALFSSKKKKIKVKLPEEDDWSESFNKNTIGISGLIKVPKRIDVNGPRTLLFGVNIARAPMPLLNTKIVTLSPRYIFANYLGYPVHLRQIDKQKSDGITIIQIDDQQKHVFQPDIFSTKIAVEVSSNRKGWSGPFSIDNIEDFQIRFPDEKQVTESQESLKVDDSKWYIPSIRNGNMHYARVIVVTEDEATIFVNFVIPKDPEFKIFNGTSESLVVRQKSHHRFSMAIDPGSSVPWAYDNHLANNKKISVKGKTIRKNYSLEKVQEAKNFGKYKVEVTVEGVTRQLAINEPNVPKGNKIFEILYEKFAIRSEFRVVLDVQGVGVSIIDEKPSEKLYVSISKIYAKVKKAEVSFGKRVDSTYKADFKIGNFQIDNMDNVSGQYPVIFSPTEVVKEEGGEIIPFLQFKIQRELRIYRGTETSAIDKIT